MAKQYREGSSFTRYVCTVSQKDEKTDTTWQDVTSKPHIYISITDWEIIRVSSKSYIPIKSYFFRLLL